MLLVILEVKKLLKCFAKKNYKNTNRKEFIAEKVIKRKEDKLYVKWKGYGNSFNSWIDKKDIVLMTEYFLEPKSLRGRVKVELDLPNYVTKADLKNSRGLYTSKFVKKIQLANLKSNIDKLNFEELKNLPTSLSNLTSKLDKLDVDKLVSVPVDLIT